MSLEIESKALPGEVEPAARLSEHRAGLVAVAVRAHAENLWGHTFSLARAAAAPLETGVAEDDVVLEVEVRFRGAHELFRAMHSLSWEGTALLRLGCLQTALGDYERAEELLDKARGNSWEQRARAGAERVSTRRVAHEWASGERPAAG